MLALQWNLLFPCCGGFRSYFWLKFFILLLLRIVLTLFMVNWVSFLSGWMNSHRCLIKFLIVFFFVIISLIIIITIVFINIIIFLGFFFLFILDFHNFHICKEIIKQLFGLIGFCHMLFKSLKLFLYFSISFRFIFFSLSFVNTLEGCKVFTSNVVNNSSELSFQFCKLTTHILFELFRI